MDGSRRELIGLGHDLQLVDELAAASALHAPGAFFTGAELTRFASSVVPAESLAGGFAAKEALFKALPAVTGTWFWTDAELTNDQCGKPKFRTHGALAEFLSSRHLALTVSISHSGGFASSVVVVSRETPERISLSGTMRRAVTHVLRRVAAASDGAPE